MKEIVDIKNAKGGDQDSDMDEKYVTLEMPGSAYAPPSVYKNPMSKSLVKSPSEMILGGKKLTDEERKRFMVAG